MRTEGLRIVRARAGAAEIVADVPAAEIARQVAEGRVFVVKGALDAAELRRARRAIIGWRSPDVAGDQMDFAHSTRQRREHSPATSCVHAFESFLFNLEDPADPIGAAVRAPFARIAAFWRTLTGSGYGFRPDADGRALRPFAMYYPAGGGCFGWHEHKLEPQQIGLIAALSESGVDFHEGATEFRTPAGLVSIKGDHDIGDLCLFRYDLPHQVTPVDPDRERRWDGAGRWTLVIPVQ